MKKKRKKRCSYTAEYVAERKAECERLCRENPKAEEFIRKALEIELKG